MGYKSFYLLIVLMLLISACSSTKYVPENEYLLDRVIIKSDSKDIKSADLKPYLKQSPNLKIFGAVKFHLGIYNLSGKKDKHWYDRWLKRIGEEPVIYDSLINEKSSRELTKYLLNKGYLNATVDDSVHYKSRKKATVIYKVKPGLPYIVEDHQMKIEDPIIDILVTSDSANSLIKPGISFDVDVFDQERERITKLLKNEGYFKFSKEYIHFDADSSMLNHSIRDTLVVRNPNIINELGEKAESMHTRYTIRNTYFITDYDPKEALRLQNKYYDTFDTLIVEGHHFLFHDAPNIKPIVFILNNLIKPGDPYKLENVERTHSLLNSIPIVQYVNIRFYEAFDEIDPMLDCVVQITPARKHLPSIDVEATHQDSYFGAALNGNYQHRNLLKGGEQLGLKLRLAREYQKKLDGTGSHPADEFGFESSLMYPRFLFPLLSRSFRENFKSSTKLSASYNFQDRPDYNREISNISVNYNWKGKSNWNHSLDLIDFNLVDLRDTTSNFNDYINDIVYLRYSYDDHIIHSINYAIWYNNQQERNFRNSKYLRFGIESAGNALYGLNTLLNSNTTDGSYELLGIKFSQYIKFDTEGTYNQYINDKNSLAFHSSLGIAFPYGNVDVMPFEKRYFGGGANGIRGWQVRRLGPGAYYSDELDYWLQSGDIKFQFNAEYRFKLFWVLEGAFFLDGGNIWTIREYEGQEAGYFKLNSFYKQMALAYGVGARFDFNFFVFRLDWGFKGYDPAAVSGSNWVSKPFNSSNHALHLAIGYPF